MNVYIITGSQRSNPWMYCQLLALIAAAAFLWASIQTAVYVASAALIRPAHFPEQHRQSERITSESGMPTHEIDTCRRHMVSHEAIRVATLSSHAQE